MDESDSIIDDSDYEDEDSMELLPIKHDETRPQNVIGDSDEDRSSSVRTSTNPSARSSLSGSAAEDRLTPFITKAIRRSFHQFRKESSEEEDSSNAEESNPEIEEASDESSNSAPVPVTQQRRRNAIEDNTSEEESEGSAPLGESSIEEVESPLQRSYREPRSADSKKSSKNHQRKRIVVEYDSSDDENRPPNDQSNRSIRKSASPDKKSIERRARDRSSDSAEQDESADDESEEAYSSDHLEGSMQNGERSARKRSESKQSNSSSEIEILDVTRKQDKIHVLDSSDDEGNDNGDTTEGLDVTVATGLAEEEASHSDVNPISAQQQALLAHKHQQLQTQLAKAKMIYSTGNMSLLPDKGERLRLSIAKYEQELAEVSMELHHAQRQDPYPVQPKQEGAKVASMFKQDSLDLDPAFLKPTLDNEEKELGKKAQETFQREQSLTVERLKDLHGSLLARPTEDERAEDPRGLKVPLMPHQQHALAWMLWRERQNPSGGVLADDMGLGKTLTMIALVMAANAKRDGDEDSEDEDTWMNSARPIKHVGGTLVVAPASLLAQWAAEVENRCKRGLLTVELYHGTNRENVPKRLARNDIVVTTYNILSREFKVTGILYKIRWRRVILDEAHVIRNHKSQTCEAVCGLHASKRWALTGTPIHNKEMDLYSILKFLQCSPFDDVRVWKRWVDNKNAAGQERLATVMKTLMLRRTKAELQAKGELESMPEKSIEVIEVTLDPEERLVYDKVMVYSRTLFAQFLAQRAEKAHMFELGAGKYDKPSWTTTYKDTQFTKAQNQLLSLHADVKSHEILVLLLRLRQVCCHPSLINAMLDQEDIEQAAIEDGSTDADLLAKMGKMKIKSENEEDAEQEGDVGVDVRVSEHLLTSDNPVFDPKRQSSKMRAIVSKVEEILEKGDKMIIVSQWVGVLNVIADVLDKIRGAAYRMFSGKVAVKDRQGVLDDFNSRNPKPNILLLSLTAGGVGLNLVRANHLLLVDIHWNPQLESQAQDRIYRFGQKKNVFIYKYICTDTIEERIQGLQEKKLELATNVLSGGGKVIGSKLSLDDIKSLFSL